MSCDFSQEQSSQRSIHGAPLLAHCLSVETRPEGRAGPLEAGKSFRDEESEAVTTDSGSDWAYRSDIPGAGLLRGSTFGDLDGMRRVRPWQVHLVFVLAQEFAARPGQAGDADNGGAAGDALALGPSVEPTL